MTSEAIETLVKERSTLFNQYTKAHEKEKFKILVKIMDIDERLEVPTIKPHPPKVE